MRLNPFRKDDNFFKAMNTEVKKEIKAIKKVADPVARLARYESLKEKFNSLYGNDQIQQTADNIRMTKGSVAFASGAGGALMLVMSTVAAASLFAGAFLPTLLVGVVVGGCYVLAARQFYYNTAALGTGLKTKDVKYVARTNTLKKKVDKAVTSLSIKIKLENVRKKFNKGADGTKEPASVSAPVVKNTLTAPKS